MSQSQQRVAAREEQHLAPMSKQELNKLPEIVTRTGIRESELSALVVRAVWEIRRGMKGW